VIGFHRVGNLLTRFWFLRGIGRVRLRGFGGAESDSFIVRRNHRSVRVVRLLAVEGGVELLGSIVVHRSLLAAGGTPASRLVISS
jgi:hypothetical protein